MTSRGGRCAWPAPTISPRLVLRASCLVRVGVRPLFGRRHPALARPMPGTESDSNRAGIDRYNSNFATATTETAHICESLVGAGEERVLMLLSKKTGAAPPPRCALYAAECTQNLHTLGQLLIQSATSKSVSAPGLPGTCCMVFLRVYIST